MTDLRSITPEPTDEEAAAIVAALTMAWPRPPAPTTATTTSSVWRFSGRWWQGRRGWRR